MENAITAKTLIGGFMTTEKDVERTLILHASQIGSKDLEEIVNGKQR